MDAYLFPTRGAGDDQVQELPQMWGLPHRRIVLRARGHRVLQP
jgi:hypothetical protein